MKPGVLILFFSLISLGLLAQPLHTPDLANGKITGIVQDSTSSKGVEFATVALLDPNTQKPINGEVCDDKGKFTLSKIPAGTYTLGVSAFQQSSVSYKLRILPAQ